jgi:hypothetical protein
MFARMLLRLGRRTAGRRGIGRRRRAPKRLSPALSVVALEERTLPSTFSVVNLDDSGPGSLRAAVSAANANPGPDVIKFGDGLAGTIGLTSGELDITDDLTIKGNGAITVDGSDTSGIFEVANDASATIRALTLAHGSASLGGAIRNEAGSTLTLTGCTLEDNQAVADSSGDAAGGAVWNAAGAVLDVTDCAFVDNQAVGGSTGASADGGAVDNLGTATIEDTSFLGNHALGGANADGTVTTGSAGGGAIENAGAPDGSVFGVLTLRDCRFEDNQAVGGDNAGIGDFFNGAGVGGAVKNVNHSQLTITGGLFEDNQALAGSDAGSPALGGAIWNGLQSTLSLDGCVLENNEAQGGSSGLGPVGGNAFGGAVDNYGASAATVADCVLADNTVLGGPGTGSGDGAFAGGGGISSGDRAILFGVPDPCSVAIRDTLFAGNRVGGGASGGVQGDLNSGGDALGGGLFMADGPVEALRCLFWGNEAVGGTGINGPAGDGYGGAIAAGYNGGTARLDLDATLVTANRAIGGRGVGDATKGDGEGGGLYVTGGAQVFVDSMSAVFGNLASTTNNNILGSFTRD